MAWRLAGSLITLRDQYNAAYPNRSKASDGTLGDAAHAAVKSEHNPNAAGVVTAMDITHDPAHGADMNVLKESLIQDSRTWYVIFNRRIWERGVGWYAYNGANLHDKHLHISTMQSSNLYDDNRQWQIKGGSIVDQQARDWIAGVTKTVEQLVAENKAQAQYIDGLTRTVIALAEDLKNRGGDVPVDVEALAKKLEITLKKG